jgi:hypothetical protein
MQIFPNNIILQEKNALLNLYLHNEIIKLQSIAIYNQLSMPRFENISQYA